MIENLLGKMYIEGVCMSKFCNIVNHAKVKISAKTKTKQQQQQQNRTLRTSSPSVQDV